VLSVLYCLGVWGGERQGLASSSLSVLASVVSRHVVPIVPLTSRISTHAHVFRYRPHGDGTLNRACLRRCLSADT